MAQLGELLRGELLRLSGEIQRIKGNKRAEEGREKMGAFCSIQMDSDRLRWIHMVD